MTRSITSAVRRPPLLALALLAVLAAVPAARASSRLLLASPSPAATAPLPTVGGRPSSPPAAKNDYPPPPAWTCRCGFEAGTDAPVCGANNRSYINACMAVCDRAAPFRSGPCGGGGAAAAAAAAAAGETAPPEGATTPKTPTTPKAPTAAPVVAPTPPAKGDARQFDGQAPVTCRCARLYLPQCGEDGKTYANPCLRSCERVALRTEGPCAAGATEGRGAAAGDAAGNAETDAGAGAGADADKKKIRPGCAEARMCTANFAPVCGTDGKTYSNDCVFECRPVGVERRAAGECKSQATETPPPTAPPTPAPPASNVRPGCDNPARPCTMEFNPICGTDGKTYGNPCDFACRPVGVEKRGLGECGSERKEPACACPLIYAPVCTEDGRTLSNACLARCEGARVAKQAPCAPAPKAGTTGTPPPPPTKAPQTPKTPPTTTPKACRCTREFRAVCGADGKDYPNPCMAGCAGVKVAKDAPCVGVLGEPLQPEEPIEPPPVRGQGSGGGGAAAAGGAPSPCVCTREFKQVCGRDGKTYNNMCLLQCASVEYKSSGPCPSASGGVGGGGRAASAPSPPASAPARLSRATGSVERGPSSSSASASTCGCTGALRGLCAAFRRVFDASRCNE